MRVKHNLTLAVRSYNLVNVKTDGCDITGMLHFFFKTKGTIWGALLYHVVYFKFIYLYIYYSYHTPNTRKDTSHLTMKHRAYQRKTRLKIGHIVNILYTENVIILKKIYRTKNTNYSNLYTVYTLYTTCHQFSMSSSFLWTHSYILFCTIPS